MCNLILKGLKGPLWTPNVLEGGDTFDSCVDFLISKVLEMPYL